LHSEIDLQLLTPEALNLLRQLSDAARQKTPLVWHVPSNHCSHTSVAEHLAQGLGASELPSLGAAPSTVVTPPSPAKSTTMGFGEKDSVLSVVHIP
jgi:hypothetical protein